MARTITIPDPEDERIHAFQARHMEIHKHEDPTAIGGRFTLEVTSTGLGPIINVSCACGAREDVTAYGEW